MKMQFEESIIVRMWKGGAANDTATDACEALSKERFLPTAADLAGLCDAHVLRRQMWSVEPEFVTLTRFDSPDAVKAFAGKDCGRARIGGRAHELLSRHDAFCGTAE